MLSSAENSAVYIFNCHSNYEGETGGLKGDSRKITALGNGWFEICILYLILDLGPL